MKHIITTEQVPGNHGATFTLSFFVAPGPQRYRVAAKSYDDRTNVVNYVVDTWTSAGWIHVVNLDDRNAQSAEGAARLAHEILASTAGF